MLWISFVKINTKLSLEKSLGIHSHLGQIFLHQTNSSCQNSQEVQPCKHYGGCLALAIGLQSPVWRPNQQTFTLDQSNHYNPLSVCPVAMVWSPHLRCFPRLKCKHCSPWDPLPDFPIFASLHVFFGNFSPKLESMTLILGIHSMGRGNLKLEGLTPI
jgi:hypothetical protein